jgi:hypothetical protein
LFNLITDLVGGVRFSVLEEEVQARAERGTEKVLDDPAPVVITEPEVIEQSQSFEAATAESTDEAIAG